MNKIEQLEKKWRDAWELRDIQRKESNSAERDFKNTEEYQKWDEINTQLFGGNFNNSWRKNYGTFEEALEVERIAYEAALNTPEYKNINIVRMKLDRLESLFSKTFEDYIAAEKGT